MDDDLDRWMLAHGVPRWLLALVYGTICALIIIVVCVVGYVICDTVLRWLNETIGLGGVLFIIILAILSIICAAALYDVLPERKKKEE